MKKTLVIIIVLIIFLGLKDADTYQVSGTVNGVSSGKVYLQRFDEKMFFNIDSTEIKDGKFAFSTKLKLPEVYGLSLDTTKGSFLLFLDNNPVVVKLDSSFWYKNTLVTGSALQDEYTAYKKLKNVKIDEYIKNHSASLVTAYVLYREYVYRLNIDELKANIALLAPELHETPYVKTLNKLTKVYETVAIGKKVPLFEANTPEGQTVNLSERLGKGYLLIDFWASWCRPCRKENPNLVKVYDKYKSKGFDIFGVSLDREHRFWSKAIEDDKLVWTNVSDLKHWYSQPAKLYGVRVIPSNFLVNSEGTIIAKNLRGNDLGEYLSKLLD
ncbi:MAG: AhpC/TSA family protein [Flavobacteriaceae bacterium]|jgi:peroxiredoxin|nr:AhpC/TSA family protein [Flavobacteriaceae bacterium]